MFMNLSLNIIQWFLKEILDIVLLWLALDAILACQISKILEHWAYILRFGSHLLKKLYYCFHEVLCLFENFGSSFIKFVLIFRVLKPTLLLCLGLLSTLCCRIRLLINRLEQLHLRIGSSRFDHLWWVIELLTGGMMYVIITTVRHVYTHLLVVLLLYIGHRLRRSCFSRGFWSAETGVYAGDQLVDVGLLARSWGKVLF